MRTTGWTTRSHFFSATVLPGLDHSHWTSGVVWDLVGANVCSSGLRLRCVLNSGLTGVFGLALLSRRLKTSGPKGRTLWNAPFNDSRTRGSSFQRPKGGAITAGNFLPPCHHPRPHSVAGHSALRVVKLLWPLASSPPLLLSSY